MKCYPLPSPQELFSGEILVVEKKKKRMKDHIAYLQTGDGAGGGKPDELCCLNSLL